MTPGGAINRYVTMWVIGLFILAMFAMFGLRLVNLLPSFTPQTSGVEARYSYFIDGSNSHILSYVRSNAIFRSIDDPSEIEWAIGDKRYWIKLNLENTSNKKRDLALFFDTPLIDRLDVFRFDASGNRIQRWTLGDAADRGFSVESPLPSASFTVSAKEQAVFYICVSSSGVPVMPVWLMDQSELKTANQLIHLLWGAFVSMMVIVALYNLAIYFSLYDRVYLAYVAFVVVSLTQLAAIHGFGIYIFPGNIQQFFSNNVVSLRFGMFICAMFFVYLYLQLDKQGTFFTPLVKSTAMLLSGLLLLSLVLKEHISSPLLSVVQIPFYFFILSMIWSRWKSEQTWSRLFILSWVPIFITGIFPSLLFVGGIDYSFGARYAFMFGTMLSVLFMAFALAERFRNQREDSIHKLTHDSLSSLPNTNVLKINLEQLIESNINFVFCCFQIEGYGNLSPYLVEEEKKKYVGEVIRRIDGVLDSDDIRVLETGNHSRVQRVATMNEGTFGFVVLTSSPDSCELLLSSVIDEVDGYIPLRNFIARLRGTVGLSSFPRDGINCEMIINKALQALAGTNITDSRINQYNSLDNFNRTLNMSLVADLKSAIDNNELELFHQPQIDLRTGSIHGSEVLLCWTHPKFGAISPELFVHLAEDVGLINELTMWVLRRAFIQQQKLMDEGYSRRLSINISAADIAIPNLVDRIAGLSEEFRIPTSLVSLELTESVMISDYNHLRNLISDLSEYGIEVSIDDYGTGYSSLNYLSQLPFTELKIDMSFIKNLTTSPRKQSIVRATTEMAKSLGVMVVAEGVEDEDIEELLKRYGVDVGQGYYYSKPLSFSQYLLYLKRSQKQIPLSVHRTRRSS